MNFQVTVLKILVSCQDGFASMADLKRDMAILATSGREWAERTKRLAGRVPNLDIFSHKLVERIMGGWRITENGRAVLEFMKARSTAAEAQDEPSRQEKPLVLRLVPAATKARTQARAPECEPRARHQELKQNCGDLRAPRRSI
ncbi:hypothetical protein [Bradyrhizobium sp. USDA 4011]